eukprot:maker-scaffold155_size301336-snap-gene-0.12 protein:Tk03779 transcript:maker-scaffold155_size301336-snap-gene-0.12-mRNA-1 annotation:"predicted protein"
MCPGVSKYLLHHHQPVRGLPRGVAQMDVDVFKRFCEIQEPPVNLKTITYEQLKQIVVSYGELSKCPELKENPFRKRICRVFSVDESANLTFDEFLNMYSVFSEKTPREMKVHYAFLIYDFDGDTFVGPSDIEHAVKLLTQNELGTEEIESIWEKVLYEADIDDDKKLSSSEFEHVITKSPDFITTFHFRI